MNAVLRHLGLVEKTVHCKNDGPKECALLMGSWINERGISRVGLVGMQPALLEALTRTLGPDSVIVSDLADAGKERCGIKVLDGTDSTEVFEHCQLIRMTGSTLVNAPSMALWRIFCAAEEESYSMEPQLRVRLTSWAWKDGALVQLEL